MTSVGKIYAAGMHRALKMVHLAGRPQIYRPKFGPALTVTPDFANMTLNRIMKDQPAISEVLNLVGEFGYQKVEFGRKEDRPNEARSLEITFDLNENEADSKAVFYLSDLLLCGWYPQQARDALSSQLRDLLDKKSSSNDKPSLRMRLAEKEQYFETSRKFIYTRNLPESLLGYFKGDEAQSGAQSLETKYFNRQYGGRVILIFGSENFLVRRPLPELLDGYTSVNELLCYLDRRAIHDARDFIIQLEICLGRFAPERAN